MHGAINVGEVVRQQARMQEFQQRMALHLEQMVLSMWWRLLRAARAARTNKRRREVALEQLRFKRLYGPELSSALKKWEMAMAERAVLAKGLKRRTRPSGEATGF